MEVEFYFFALIPSARSPTIDVDSQFTLGYFFGVDNVSTLMLESTMAKKKTKPVSIKLQEDLVQLIKIVAAYRGGAIHEYIEERLRPLVEADLARYQKQHQRRAEDDS